MPDLLPTTTIERTTTVTDPDLEQDEPKASHIIARGKDGKDANAIVMEAMIEGTPVEALCGHVFVPTRDPQRYPPCQKCLDIAQQLAGRNN